VAVGYSTTVEPHGEKERRAMGQEINGIVKELK
jgi:hypothetical protein